MPRKWISFSLSTILAPKQKESERNFQKSGGGGGSDELTEAKFGLLDYLLTNKEWWQVHFASGYSQQRSRVPRVAEQGAAAPLCCLRLSGRRGYCDNLGSVLELDSWGGGWPVWGLCSIRRIIWLASPVFLFLSNLGHLNSVVLVLHPCDFVMRAGVSHGRTASWVRSRLRATAEDAAMS